MGLRGDRGPFRSPKECPQRRPRLPGSQDVRLRVCYAIPCPPQQGLPKSRQFAVESQNESQLALPGGLLSTCWEGLKLKFLPGVGRGGGGSVRPNSLEADSTTGS